MLFEYYNERIVNVFERYDIYTLKRKVPLYNKKNKPEVIVMRGVKIEEIFDVPKLEKKYELEVIKT